VADILVIHGINMSRSMRSRMADSWHAAIREGLHNIRSLHADSLTIECAFFGHLYNDGKSAAEPSYQASDLAPGFQTELVLAMADALDDADGREGRDAAKVWLPRRLQRALVRLQRSRVFDGLDRVLISFVKQVDRYLHDDEFRSAVHTEFAAAMRSGPRLVIGHSLGSVIAYDWLREHDDAASPSLVTLGSPLGLEAIRRHQRIGRPRWPGSVRAWTNIAAHLDPVAMVKELAPLYHRDIVDQPCDNPRSSAHSAVSYLSNVRTARAIEVALG
jgi:hypothetical protein